MSGEISVCKWIKFACERHNRDLTREDLYFDEAAAERAIKFIQLMKHVKGKWAGKYIKLEPWQKFFVGSLFGWKWKATELRRFREGNLTIPRKNGKTTLFEGIDLYMVSADGEFGAEVVLGASKEPQAKELFDIAHAMVRMNENYTKFYKPTITTETIKIPKTNSIYKYVIGKPADGGNSHAAHIEAAQSTVVSKHPDTALGSYNPTPQFPPIGGITAHLPPSMRRSCKPSIPPAKLPI